MKKLSLKTLKYEVLAEYSPIEQDENGKWYMHIQHSDSVPFSEKKAKEYNKKLDSVWNAASFKEFVMNFKKLDSWRTWDDVYEFIVEDGGSTVEKWFADLIEEFENKGLPTEPSDKFFKMIMNAQDKLFSK